MNIYDDKNTSLLHGLAAFFKGSRFLSRRPDEQARVDLITQSPLFDVEYYVANYPDVRESGINPAVHYLRYTGPEGRNPSAEFDAQFYLKVNPDVRTAKINPLVHYLLHGRQEGRKIRAVFADAPRPKAPDRQCWDELASLQNSRDAVQPTIDIIIPVFRGFDETANCLYTVLQSRLSAKIGCEIIVVNDASPDGELAQLLEELASRGLITLLRNSENKGFVASVNSGMAFHDSRDVIILNSDTEVFGDWVERLHRAAYSDYNVGTVTPFSNNATIFSYPNFCDEFGGVLEVSFAELDQLASGANAGKTVDVPTANGFCMYIRRECLREVGLFDAKSFGRGYGEENDFSRRIAARGWRNILAGDVFVRHIGRVSFSNTGDALQKRALEIINNRYPHYDRDIAEYIRKDPPKLLRRNLDVARLRRVSGKRPFLFILHNLGGGTPRHVRELSALLAADGIGSLLLQPHANDGNFALLNHAGLSNLSNATRIDIKHGLSDAVELLRDLGVLHIHVHHVLGFALEFPQFVKVLASKSNLRYDITLHDYLSVCPRVDMVDASEMYCDNQKLEVCESCIKNGGSPFGDVSVWLWRARHADFLAGARKVFVPDEDAKIRLTQFLPSLSVTVRPHPESVPQVFAQPVIRKPGELLRVAIIGAIGLHKGSRILRQCAQDAARRHLPIKFHVLGYTDIDDLLQLPNVEITGRYSDGYLPTLLVRSRCHLAFFPAVWPETYSYTLSQAWFAGMYPVAFDLGALGRRIRESGWGYILPADTMRFPARVNDLLLSLKPTERPTGFNPVIGSRAYHNIWHDYYELD